MKLIRQKLRTRSKARADRGGASLVEFSIVAPVIFLFFLGGLELTSLNFARQTVGIASYEAARKMIIPGGTVAQAQAEGLRQLSLVGIGTGATVTVTDTPTTVSVTVRVPASTVSWGLTRFSAGYSLQQTCKLTKE